MLLGETKRLLKQYNLHPVNYRGQNFLVSKKILKKIIKAARLTAQDRVLEVGPGLGFLTKELARHSLKVVAIEVDKNLVQVLSNELKDYENVKIINKNILRVSRRELEEWLGGEGEEVFYYKIVANLPYHITSRFLRQFLEGGIKPKEMVLMVQKEVAERITAQPGKMSLLAVSCQFYADCQIVGFVGRNNFWPSPRVDSAIIKLKIKNEKLKIKEGLFFRIVRAGFSQKRKKLITNLAKNLGVDKERLRDIFKELGLEENCRAQDLSIEDWIKLANCSFLFSCYNKKYEKE